MFHKELPVGKKIYFASDFHLGAPNADKSRERELRIIRWLDSVKHDAEIIFLVGDLFDFWFEYKLVIPKGYVRFFGKLAELSDAGIELIIFKGNHDMWMDDYFTKELNIKVFRESQQYVFNKKKFYVGHGDGLGPGDYAYKFLKRIFEGTIPKLLFGRVMHPNLGMFLGYAWASNSWKKHEKEDDVYHFESEDKEYLFQYCREVEAKEHHDFYVFGHRHHKFDLQVNSTSRYINLGDWVFFRSYGVFDGENMELRVFEG